MKKMFLILILALWLSSNNISFASYVNISHTISNLDKIFFTAKPEQIDILNEMFSKNLEVKCYDNNWALTDKVSFTCWNTWLSTKLTGCWVKRNNSYDQLLGHNCILKRIDKDVWIKFNLTIFKYDTDLLYPKSFDITNNMNKKSIQAKELSCESSATSDILTSVLWQTITEDDVISKLPRSEYWKSAWLENGKRYWGDPDVWFVWYIDKFPKTNQWALQWKYEGYWVYETPLSKVYNDYWVNNEIINIYNRNEKWINTQKEHLTFLLKELTKWNYVQLWGDTCTYPKYEDWTKSWKLTTTEANNWIVWKNNCVYPYNERALTWYVKQTNWTEKKITWLNWEHAFYLLWYKWTISNPTHIIVWDTNTWRHEYQTIEWLRKWWKMQDRSILVKIKE